MPTVFGRIAAAHVMDAGIEQLARSGSPFEAARAEDLRTDSRVSPVRENEILDDLTRRYGPDFADPDRLAERLESLSYDTVQQPLAGEPQFSLPKLNSDNHVGGPWRHVAASFRFSQILDLVFIATLIKGSAGSDPELRPYVVDVQRALTSPPAGGVRKIDTLRAAWLKVLDDLDDDVDRLKRVAAAVLRVAARDKAAFHPTWLTPLAGGGHLTADAQPGVWEEELARRGKRANDSYYVHLVYAPSDLISADSGAIVPTVLDGGTVGVWFRAPRPSAFNARALPSDRLPSGFAVDLRASKTAGELTRELIFRDCYQLWPKAFHDNGEIVKRAYEQPEVPGVGLMDPCVLVGHDIDVGTARDRHKGLLASCFGIHY